MVTGGIPGRNKDCTASAEIVDATSGHSVEVSPMTSARCGHTLTLLGDGSVLVIGGDRQETEFGIVQASSGTAERWNPTTGRWVPAGTLTLARQEHTATLLPDGRVLVVGGTGVPDAPAEVWEANNFHAAGTPATVRSGHVALLRSDGRVLVAFGGNGGSGLRETELWDPSTSTWSSSESIPKEYAGSPRIVSLKDDNYLVGKSDGGAAKRWNILSNTWEAVNGDLRVGPVGTSAFVAKDKLLIGSLLYDVTADLVFASDAPFEPTQFRSTLNDGRIVDIGHSSNTAVWTNDLNVAATWRQGHAFPYASHSSITPLESPSLLVSGGSWGSDDYSRAFVLDLHTGSWTKTASLHAARDQHVGVLLRDGRVLVAGGKQASRAERPKVYKSKPSPREKPPLELDAIEIWNPSTGRWLSGGRMSVPRQRFTASSLADGGVLLVGGEASRYEPVEYDDHWRLEGKRWAFEIAEVWSPRTNKVERTGSMNAARTGHAAVVLPDSRVLVTGGEGGSVGTLASAEIWDPHGQTWSYVSDMGEPRTDHTATLLGDGRVLVVGGRRTAEANIVTLASAEVWDPDKDLWTPVAPLTFARSGHHAATLDDGRIIIAGGSGETRACDGTGEVWDPSSQTWTKTATLPLCIERLVESPDGVVAIMADVRASRGKRQFCTARLVPGRDQP
jgi:N-acetylneuraminic acid mutarotase